MQYLDATSKTTKRSLFIFKARILKWFAFPFPVDHVLSDLQDLPELTPPKNVLFIIGDWTAKETPGVMQNLALEYRMKQGKG